MGKATKRRKELMALLSELIKDPLVFQTYWAQVIFPKFQQGKVIASDVLRNAMALLIIKKSKEPNPYVKPFVDQKKDEEIRWLFLIPNTPYHIDLHCALYQIFFPEVFGDNAARVMFEQWMVMKFHPDNVDNFCPNTLGHILALATGDRPNSFLKDPVNCVFQIKALQVLLSRGYDLDSPAEEIQQNDELCGKILETFDVTEQFVRTRLPSYKITKAQTSLSELFTKMKINQDTKKD